MESFEAKLSRVLAERIELVDYDPAWPALFDAECARLAAFFPPGSTRRIEHVGSTAVPGLAAKPIIDILVGVDDFGFVVDSVAPAMERAGYDYFFRPELGDDGPRYPWFIGRDASGVRVSHIHVALVDDAPQWDRVVFRDYLRGHRDAALEYAQLKRELAARFSGDREAYTLAKTAFVTDAVARARGRAQQALPHRRRAAYGRLGWQTLAGAPLVKRQDVSDTGRGTVTDIRLRTADTSDRDVIFALLRSAAAWLGARDIDYWQNWLAPPAHHTRWVDDGLSAGEFRLIEGSDGVLGCVRLQDSDPLFWPGAQDAAGYVHSLTIDRRFAGQGLGARVLDAIASELAARGVSLLRLDCGESATGLRRYYESLGFRSVGTTVVDGESLVLYERHAVE